MPQPKLTKLELQIMEALWTLGPCSVREIQESFPARKRPAYTTVQTTVYRLEIKGALRRTKKSPPHSSSKRPYREKLPSAA
jgi:BlaI family penicillinase repressor